MTDRLPVVFITPTLCHGGAERVLHEVVANLDRERFERHVVCFVQGADVFRFDADVSVHVASARFQGWSTNGLTARLFRNATTVIRLSRVLDRLPPNAVLVPFLARPTTAYTLLAQPFGQRPVIASLHTTESVYMRFAIRSPLRRRIESRVLTFACRHSNEIVAVSEGVKNDLVGFGVSPGKIRIIPNPLNLDIIRKQAASGDFGHCLEQAETTFVHIGRLSPEKNHRLLIEAAAVLRERYERFQVLIAGTGDQEASIRRWIQEASLEDKIFLLGRVDNPYALMAGARALILTSHYDSSPMVLKEAMASGTAVISVDCPHGPSEILQQGRFGILVPSNQPAALARAMFDIAQDDVHHRQLVQQGGRRSLDYDVKEIIKDWEKLFDQYWKPSTKSRAFASISGVSTSCQKAFPISRTRIRA